MPHDYLHGYTDDEQKRLYRQARFLEQIVYHDIDLSGVRRLLEVGCGVGAQTEILLRRFPDLHIQGIDVSDTNVRKARQFLEQSSYAAGRFDLRQMNAEDMDFPESPDCDGAFFCWILEHVASPVKVLAETRRVLNRGSIVTITEVLNATFFVEPYSPNVMKYWMRYNDFQYDNGGDPFIGGKLGNFLQSQGYTDIRTQVKTLHFDNREPAKRADMIHFWTNLLLSGTPRLLQANYIEPELVDRMKEEMHAVAKDPNAVFFYSFIQAQAST